MHALLLLCAAVAVASSAEIDPCLKKCNKMLRPVCGSDHRVYNNRCLLEIAQCRAKGNLQEVSMGECEKREVDPCMKGCNKMLKPVCGSDHRVYNNRCLLEIAQCRAKGNLQEVSMGECEKRDVDPCMKGCNKMLKPVCGSDHRVYNNRCLLEIAQCQAGRSSASSLDERPMSFCQTPSSADPCFHACTKEWDPTCGSDGRVYGNHCMFQIGQCRAQLTSHPLTEMSAPFCQDLVPASNTCQKQCSNDLDLVCGSDGVIYMNRCRFDIAVCRSSGELEERTFYYCTVN